MRKQIIEIFCLCTFFVTILLLIYVITNFDIIKDDGLTYLSPNLYLQGKTFFENFQLAQINYFQMLGIPLLPQAQTGVLYFPHYFFYFITNLFSSGINDPLRVEFIFNITFGALFVYKLIKEEGFTNGYARIGATAYLLSGPVLVLAGNWPILSVYLGLLPLAFWAVKKKRWGVLIFANILMLYAGHFQFFLIVFAYTSAYYFYQYSSRRDVLRYIIISLLAITISSPVILPTASSMYKTSRVQSRNTDAFTYSITPTTSLLSIAQPVILKARTYALYNVTGILYIPLVPVSLLIFIYKKRQTKLTSNMMQFARMSNTMIFVLVVLLVTNILHLYFLGDAWQAKTVDYITTSFLIYLTVYSLTLFKKKKTRVLFWLNATLITLILTSGFYFFLNIINPYYLVFRWPVKWALMLPLSTSLLGVYILSSVKITTRAQNTLLGLIVLLSLVTYKYWGNTFNFNPYYKSYKNVGSDIIGELKSGEGRFYTAGKQDLLGNSSPLYTSDNNVFYIENFTNGLTANYSTYFGLLSANGYDPLSSDVRNEIVGYQQMSTIGDPNYFTPEKLRTYQKFGVNRYLILNNDAIGKKLESYGMKKHELKEGVIVYRDPRAEEIITSDSTQPVEYKVIGNNINMYPKKSSNPQTITVRFLKEDENWRAKADGVGIPVTKDSFNRISLRIPAHTNHVELEYQSQELKVGAVIAGLVLLGLLIWTLFKRLSSRVSLHTPKHYHAN